MSNLSKNNGRAIFAPYLPQMSDDGLITENDLLIENVIFVEVIEYQFAEKGDEIRLYFADQAPIFLLVNDPVKDFPIIFKIPAAPLADGTYPVYYTATDNAGNPETSPTSLAILQREGNGTLPAPIFIDAVNGQLTRNQVLAFGGARVRVPAYGGAIAGDTVTLSFYTKDNQNQEVPASQYAYVHTLSQAEVSAGFVHLVPEQYVLSINAGNAFARYTVQHINGQTDTSGLARVGIINGNNALFPAPSFPDSRDGLLTSEDVSHGIRVRFQYPGMQANDDVTLSLRGLSTENVPVTGISDSLRLIITAQQAGVGWVDILFNRLWAEMLVSGYFHSYYEVVRGGNITFSLIGSVRLNLQEQTVLPAPIFTAAQDGVLSFNDVQQQQGTPLRIAYGSLKVGDNVTAILSGRDSNQQPVAGANYQTFHQVNAAEQNAGAFTVTLPATSVLAVQDGGTLRGQYTVTPAGQSNQQNSLYSEVILKDDTTVPPYGKLAMILTYGAPPFDLAVVKLTPYNRGVIYGKPGQRVRVSVDQPAVIEESQAISYDLNLDTKGQGAFRIFNEYSGNINVAVLDLSGTEGTIKGITFFDGYHLPVGKIYVWASTTGAPANGKTPCSIYLKTDPSTKQRIDITRVRATIQGDTSAQIVGYPGQTSADILLNSDHTAEIDIVNTHAEPVNILLTLPESSGTALQLHMVFAAEPKQ